jgi:hypothetical protein
VTRMQAVAINADRDGALEARMATGAKGPLAIGRAHRIGIYVTGGGLWLSGGLWLLFHYFIQGQGAFAPAPHPLEQWPLRLHGAFAFAAIWVFGLLWGLHVAPGWTGTKRRRSGGVLVGLFSWLTLSGCLLYYVGSDRLRGLTSLLHWSLGLLIPALFLVHRLAPRGVNGTAESRRFRQPRRSRAKRG